MVTHDSLDLLTIWLEYNIFIGIKHFYIYDNAPLKKTQLHHNIKHYVEKGYVTIVPWYEETWLGFTYHSSNRRRHEIWSQNDCIQRYGYKHEWLGIFDIDEFPVLLQRGATLTHILEKVSPKYCSLMINNCFSTNPKKLKYTSITHPSKLLAFFKQDTVNTTNCHKGPRHFIRPSKVYYFRIHWLERTKKCYGSYKINQFKELRMNHYQNYSIVTKHK